eukprot:3471413-Rhodomonas_salina.1
MSCLVLYVVLICRAYMSCLYVALTRSRGFRPAIVRASSGAPKHSLVVTDRDTETDRDRE